LRSDDAAAKAKADEIYDALQKKGIEVIYDDRKVRPGAMFADADLLGVPVRVVVSPRNLEQNAVEISTRDKSIDKEMVPVENTLDRVDEIIAQLTEQINSKVE
jgi:prolyl-tRNA synthetase